MSKSKRRRLLTQKLEERRVLAATALITEFLASNSGGLEDSDGESSDWIEIYNPTTSPIDLDGWTLTDDEDDLTQWEFPTTVLDPADSIVVFASGKDRAVAGQELHTNFSLSSSGDYLALVDPTGAIANQFSPEYPAQASNVSYGLTIASEALVQPGTPASTLIPSSAVLGDTWQQVGFDDSSWIDGPVGVGYGVVEPGFSVNYVKAQAAAGFDGFVTSLTVAESVLATPAFQSVSVTERYDWINFLGTGGNGNFDNDRPFPTGTIGEDINHFVVESTGLIQIPQAGNWTFGVNSDDGFGMTLSRNGQDFTSSFPNPRADRDTITTFDLPEAGEYQVRLVTFEAAGGASAEFFAAQGVHSTFSSVFELVGDVDNGGLFVSDAYVSGSSDFVNTDIETEMSGVNSSAFVRIPFNVADPSSIDTLTLNMRFDDGFVAYVNGFEFARENAPASPAFNSTSTLQRTANEVLQPNRYPFSAAAIAQLNTGQNVLSIHGLNNSISDDSFLVSPELVSSQIFVDSPSFFATPTPGALNQDPVNGVLQRVSADVPAGFYDTAQTVTLSAPDAFAQIVYTIDGSAPTATNGMVYSGPLTINSTTTLRAIAVATDYVSLPSITRSYLFLDDVLTQSPDGSPPPGWPATWNTNDVDYGIDPDVINLEGAQRVKDSLLSLPTLSISTDLDNLFDPQIGIYSNARQDGRDWERPASAEWINPDGSPGFQVNAGLRIRGGFSRNDFNPKHALKLFFRGSYGDSTLEYPVHGDEGVSEFKKLDLRTPSNYSWSSQGNASNNFVAEVLARYNQRDLGQPYTRSTWLHLYLNGQYWGMFQTQERAEANFAASYLGGEPENYDVLKPERGAYRVEVTDGNADAYTELWAQAAARDTDGVTPAFVEYAEYMRVQGKNPDGTDNLSYPVLLDVDNVITYMVETLRGGNLDAPISNFLGNTRPNNFFAIRDRTGREGFRFFQHDAEHTMRNVNQNRNGPWNDSNYENNADYFNPQWLHQQLMANDEYRIRFADTVHYAFFNDGPLSQGPLIDRLNEEVAKIELATIAESARWGDSKRGDNTPLTQANFLNAIDNLVNSFIPARQPIVIEQFRNTTLVLKDGAGDYNVVVPAPLYPSTDAPGLLINGTSQYGGVIAEGSGLRFNSPDGPVYYMTDGSDPRELGGGINSNALVYNPQQTQTPVVESGDVWNYLDNGTQPPVDWTSLAFNDNAWNSGASELGYGDGDEATVVSFGGNSNAKHITTYFRREFDPGTTPGSLVGAMLRVKRDDGIAVYLNGQEILRNNLPGGTLTSTTTASGVVGGAGESTWLEFPIDPALLVAGGNLLAAEIHQVSQTSSDITFDAELILTTQTTPPITLNESTQIHARSRSAGGEWSALSEAFFQILNVPADASNLRVTEINYDPEVDGDAEYIELTNISSGENAVTIDLDNVTVTDGPSVPFVIPVGTTLAPGESAVLVRDSLAFQAVYPTVDASAIIGEYTGKLSNSGERVRVIDAAGLEIADLTYDVNDPWPKWADGIGGSLELIDPASVPVDQTGKPYHYRGSVAFGGTPAATGQPPSGVLVNEILAHTDPPLTDSIELFNPTTATVDLSGWFLSDSGSTPQKYRIPNGTLLAAGEHLVFDESDFNPALPNANSLVPFALNSSNGESVWLFSGDGTVANGLQDHAPFDATFNGESIGLLDGSAGRLVPLANLSLGAVNGMFRTSPLVVSEINYHPSAPSTAALAIYPTLDEQDLEFIEIQNASTVQMDLTGWRLRGESDFDFASGSMMAAGEVLLVSNFDPADPLNAARLNAFRTHYGLSESVRIEGPYSGSLSNSHGLIKLQAPDDPPLDDPSTTPHVTVDEVFYDDLAPWPVDADGTGSSLTRIWPSTLGNYFGSWNAEAPSPGAILSRPAVESVEINDGELTRSEVTKVTVTFDQSVDFSSNAFVLTNRESDAVVADLQVASSVVNGKTVVEITFGVDPRVVERSMAPNSLADGTYQLTIVSGEVVASGQSLGMAADYDFGDEETDAFFRYFGDSDGDRDVDGQDYGRFGLTFLKSSTDPEYNRALDFDGDGDVDGQDYGRFGLRFLTTIDH